MSPLLRTYLLFKNSHKEIPYGCLILYAIDESVVYTCLELRNGQRSVKVEALRQITAVGAQQIDLLDSLNALGYTLKTYLLRHSDNILEHYGLLHIILGLVVGEQALVKLYNVPRYLFKEIQRGIASPEVIDCC